MKVLVSRAEKKGDRDGRLHDFHWTDEGEPLTLPSLVCEGSQEGRDQCGCGRAFGGVESAKACTVGVVEEMDEDELRRRFEGGAPLESWGEDLRDALWGDIVSLCEAIEDIDVGLTVRIASQPNTFQLLEEVPA
jgi:hypothetical protein